MNALSALPLETPFPTDAPAPTEPNGSTHIDQLLKDPRAVLASLDSGDGLAARTRTHVLVLILGTVTFGAALGFFRGGAQIAFAAIKLPLVALVMLAVVAPLLFALNKALLRPADRRRDVALLVAALARGALVLAAETPIIWAAHAVSANYHRLVLLAVAACALAGVVSIRFLWSALSTTPGPRALVAAMLVAALGVAGAQAGWLFRPYLVRPQATSVVFMHPLEGSFSAAIEETIESAAGHYSGRTAGPR